MYINSRSCKLIIEAKKKCVSRADKRTETRVRWTSSFSEVAIEQRSLTSDLMKLWIISNVCLSRWKTNKFIPTYAQWKQINSSIFPLQTPKTLAILIAQISEEFFLETLHRYEVKFTCIRMKFGNIEPHKTWPDFPTWCLHS